MLMNRTCWMCLCLFFFTFASFPAAAQRTSGRHFTPGKPLPRIKLLYNTSESHKFIAEAIAEMWYVELGAEVTLVQEDWETYLHHTEMLKYQVERAGWIGDYLDPNTFLEMWVTGSVNNCTGWSNAEYDALIAAAARETNPERRMELFRKAEDILLNQEVPIMPIYFYVNQNIVKPHVKGMAFNLRDLHHLKFVWIEKDGRVSSEKEQVFTFNNGAEPETLDPASMTGSVESNIAMQLFEGLVINDPKTLRPIPAMAESWEISKDGFVYTFHLRKDAKWSNGDPVAARDFRYSWIRALDPDTMSDNAYQLYYIKNAKGFNIGSITDPDAVGLKEIDDYTLEVTLERPTPFFLDLVAFHTLLPVNKKSVEEHGDQWTRPENIVTNGPYLLAAWTPQDRIVMMKNPDYYDADTPRLREIIVNATNDSDLSFHMFKAGETDWLRTIPVYEYDEWFDRPETHITPFFATYYYRFNTTKPPFDDTRVRMAFNLATNKHAIAQYLLKAGQIPATHFVPPGIPGYTSPQGPDWEPGTGYTYDPDKARQLLFEAGYAVPAEAQEEPPAGIKKIKY